MIIFIVWLYPFLPKLRFDQSKSPQTAAQNPSLPTVTKKKKKATNKLNAHVSLNQ